MRKVKASLPPLVLALLLLLSCISLSAPRRPQAAVSPCETTTAAESRAECVIEVSTRRFLLEKDADVRLPMASTTKILTALIILEDCALNERVEVPPEAELAGGSSVYLRKGEMHTVEELLYGLMLRSGNDCAVSLAVHRSGSVQKFAALMNIRAAELGAEHSRFANPHGLPAEGHYTTARDLALIAAAAMENETFRKIVSTQFYPEGGWRNKNKLLTRLEGACGVKTGYSKEAGRCLVGAAEREGRLLVSVVLNSPQMYERTEELLNEAFSRLEVDARP